MTTTIELIEMKSGTLFFVIEGASEGKIQRLYLDVDEEDILTMTNKWREVVFARRRSRA
jgi:hypothetical protein